MSLVRWLAGSVSVASFRERVLGVQAYAGLGLASDTCRLLGWQGLPRLLTLSQPTGVEIVEGGAMRPSSGPLDLVGVRGLIAGGSGVRLRNAESLDEELAAMADSFGTELGGAASLHLWAMPPRALGLGWCRRASDLFFVQTAGSQDYCFRPAPRGDRNDRPEPGDGTAPAHACRLEAGDWLYVPRGWWHCTEAVDDSLSLSIEVARPWPLPVASRHRSAERPGIRPYDIETRDLARSPYIEGIDGPWAKDAAGFVVRRARGDRPPLRLFHGLRTAQKR